MKKILLAMLLVTPAVATAQNTQRLYSAPEAKVFAPYELRYNGGVSNTNITYTSQIVDEGRLIRTVYHKSGGGEVCYIYMPQRVSSTAPSISCFRY